MVKIIKELLFCMFRNSGPNQRKEGSGCFLLPKNAFILTSATWTLFICKYNLSFSLHTIWENLDFDYTTHLNFKKLFWPPIWCIWGVGVLFPQAPAIVYYLNDWNFLSLPFLFSFSANKRKLFPVYLSLLARALLLFRRFTPPYWNDSCKNVCQKMASL